MEHSYFMDIFLHIGADKCGSTAVQSGLCQNLKTFSQDIKLKWLPVHISINLNLFTHFQENRV